jgi:uncharacterized YigZ family protein
MQSDVFKTISGFSEGLFKDKGSKFLAFAHPVESVDEIKMILEGYRKSYHDARHVCYAYVLGPEGYEFRANDDGEPSGTAGRPIHGQIQSFGLTNILVVVIRYFGGVLLGTSGLINAYKSAAVEALSTAVVIEKTVDVDYIIKFEFPLLNDVMKLIKNSGAAIISQEYEMDCVMHIRIRKRDALRLKEAFEKVDTLHFES